jgi:hypothetical protein
LVVLDTNVILDRIKGKSNIQENVTAVSVIELPLILKYVKFNGKVYYPKLEDFKKAYKIQEKLYQIGKMKSFADLLIAAICINKKERLVTKDMDFKDIAETSDLEVEILK